MKLTECTIQPLPPGTEYFGIRKQSQKGSTEQVTLDPEAEL